MTWSCLSPELPPKQNYSGLDSIWRKISIHIGKTAIRAEFQLYERTHNAAHIWRCYQLWRRLMPDDLPLPRELLAYLDDCAEAVKTETDPETLKRLMGLSKPPGYMADHGGGPSSTTAATSTREQRNAMEFVRQELLHARIKGDTPRGYKTEIYGRAAKEFSYSVSHIKKLAGEWSVAKIVDQDLAEMRESSKSITN